VFARAAVTAPAAVGADTVAAVLLRHGLVATGLLARAGKVRPGRSRVTTAAGLVALEAELLGLGYLVGPRLHAHLAEQSPERLAAVGIGLLAEVERLVGAHARHVPLFRSFPRRVPADTQDLYVRRVFSLLLQEPHQPCVLCGAPQAVAAVSPCAHLVCRACWDGADYSGCPICHRRIDPCDPFLLPSTPPSGAPTLPMPRRAAVLELADDVERACYELTTALLGRRTPPSPQDRSDLLALLDRAGPAALDWFPAMIPVRETKAAVLARFVADRALADRLPQLLDRYVDTATDALRLLYALHGGDPGMTAQPARRRSLPRRARRALLARLDRLPLAALVDDLHRHRDAWLRAAENLHPFEEAARHPTVAAAFAALRGTVIDETTAFGRVLAAIAAAHPVALVRTGDRLRANTWAARVEALPAGQALPLLTTRPGELLRRTVALAHHQADPAALVDAVRAATPAASPGVLLATLGAVRAASWPAGTRLYFPRGGAARLWAEPDRRPRLPGNLAADLDAAISGELLRRAGTLPPVGTALLDAALADLVAPFTERTASKALVTLPRGSAQPLPAGRTVRLFLHWTQPAGTRVDLDLSVALYDTDGEYVGWCDYTRLRFGDNDAVHSGDLTSAPAPLGASEFVDLDVAALRKRGIRYATMIVFSYNDVPFDAMTDAFAGLMADPGRGSEPFTPKSVEQRFDLAGAVKVAAPLLLDLQTGTMRWVDAALVGSGTGHNVRRYSRTIGRLGAAADTYFSAGHRVSMWELACWHAAARADTVIVRHRDGSRGTYRRAAGEPIAGFACRLIALSPADAPAPSDASPELAALARGDVDLPDGAQVYALYPDRLDAARLRVLRASDLVGALVPTADDRSLRTEQP
jgi:hypothetical protein